MDYIHPNIIAALLNTTPETFAQDFQKAEAELDKAQENLRKVEREEEKLSEKTGFSEEWLKVRISETRIDDAKCRMDTFRSLELCGFGD